MQSRVNITKAHSLARILWRFWLAANDSRATEGHVREFAPKGDYVRIASTSLDTEKGEWLRTSDVLLVAVLQEDVALTKKPKRKAFIIDGDEWKQAEGGE